MHKALPPWWHNKGLSLTKEGTSDYKGLIVGVKYDGKLITFFTHGGIEHTFRNEPETLGNGVKYPGDSERYAIVR